MFTILISSTSFYDPNIVENLILPRISRSRICILCEVVTQTVPTEITNPMKSTCL